MSKLSSALKAQINAAHARPGTTPAPAGVLSLYQNIRREAESRDVGIKAWFSAATAATITMNSPQSLLQLHNMATENKSREERIYFAELVREIGLKCVGFNGIPRTINCLGEFRAGLPPDIISGLATQPRRQLTPENVPSILNRGQALWKSIYHPFETKLVNKLAQSHPDLPVHILESEYGNLFSDPPASPNGVPVTVGRVLTSIIAVSCLRAQTGVGPQVVSHIFGLRKAYEDGTAEAEEHIQGGKWLATDEGSIWLLGIVDRIVDCIGNGQGTTFAPGYSHNAKL
ncbi:hypothetical protein VTN49DRAFT_463 [Thermomyces lanuginosus]|uniref:uncharacterized protein n=1 Tax=Thermomyces lanuginosus TaxID=5541 RepID=UPI0037449528